MTSGQYVDVPVVDLGPFYDKNSIRPSFETSHLDIGDVVKGVGDASMSLGCFWVRVPSSRYNIEERRKVLHSIDSLFLSPSPEEKARCTSVKLTGSKADRGYIAYGSESGAKSMFENKEGFVFGYSDWGEKECINDLEGINVWPTSKNLNTDGEDWSKAKQSTLESFLFDLFVEIGNILVRIYSAMLYDGDETVLEKEWAGGETISIARIFRYFNESYDNMQEVDQSQYSQVLGSSPHTDWGLLTLIVADDVPGLQLHTSPSEGFRTIRPRFKEGFIFVNCGDYMSLLSGGVLHSPLHRVLSPALNHSQPDVDNRENERRSVVFFFYPNYNSTVPTFEDGKQKYSCFEDQGLDPREKVLTHGTFGSFISSKWNEVKR